MVKCEVLDDDGNQCGSELTDDCNFCPECGTSVAEEPEEEPPKDVVPCPETGKDGKPCKNQELKQGQKFCRFCGWKVNQLIFEPGSSVCGANTSGKPCSGILTKNERICPKCGSGKDDVNLQSSPHEGSRVSGRGEMLPGDDIQRTHTELPAPSDQRRLTVDSSNQGNQMFDRMVPSGDMQQPHTEKPVSPDQWRLTVNSSNQGNQMSGGDGMVPGHEIQRTPVEKPASSGHQQDRVPSVDPTSSGGKLRFVDGNGGSSGTPVDAISKTEDQSIPPHAFESSGPGITNMPNPTMSTGLSRQQENIHAEGQKPQSKVANLRIMFGKGEEGQSSTKPEQDSLNRTTFPATMHGTLPKNPENLNVNSTTGEFTPIAEQEHSRTSLTRDSWTPPEYVLVQASTSNTSDVSTGPCPTPVQTTNSGTLASIPDSPDPMQKTISGSIPTPMEATGSGTVASIPASPVVKCAENLGPLSSQAGIFSGRTANNQQKLAAEASGSKEPQSDDELFGDNFSGENQQAKFSYADAIKASGLFKLDDKSQDHEEASSVDVDTKQNSLDSASVGGNETEDDDESSNEDDEDDNDEDEKDVSSRSRKRRKERKNCGSRVKKKKKRDKKSSKLKKDDEKTDVGTSTKENKSAESSSRSQGDKSKPASSDKMNEGSGVDGGKTKGSASNRLKETGKAMDNQDQDKSSKKKTENESSQASGSGDTGRPSSTNTGDRESNKSSKNESSQASGRGDTGRPSSTNTGDRESNKSSKEQKNNGRKVLSDSASPASGNGMQTRSRSENVKVVFRAIFSPTILDDVNKRVFVFLEGFQPSYFQMQFVQSDAEGFIEYVCDVNIPKNLTNRTIFYNYCINDGYQDIPEYFRDQKMHAHSVRYLQFSDKIRMAGFYNKFDGVVNGRPETQWYTKLTNFFRITHHYDLLKNDVDRALRTFFGPLMSSLLTEQLTGEEVIDQLGDIISGLCNVYAFKFGIWTSYWYFENHAGKVLKPQIRSLLHAFAQQQTEKPPNLSVVLTLVHIFVNFPEFKYEEEKDIFPACFALRIQDTDEANLQKGIGDLKERFPNKLKEVTKSLQTMVNLVAGKSRNPVWLSCVPLLHFLGEESRPYDKPGLQFGHSDRKPVWWGVTNYNGSNDDFKGKSKWTEEIQPLINRMAPLFTVDYLLPRTLMTVVRDTEVEKAVASRSFTADVCLAKMYHIIKSHHLDKNDLQMLQRCLKETSEQIVVMDDKNTLYRTFKIANDVLDEAKKWNASGLFFNAATVVLQALASFDKVLLTEDKGDKPKTSSQTSPPHLGLFGTVKDDIIRWLKLNHTTMYREKECKESLQAWNAFLQISLPAGNMKDQFVADTKAQLKEEIKKRHDLDSLLGVYCEHLDIYGGDIQDILSPIAFKALEEGSTISFKHQSQKVTWGRYGDLLSKVFEKQWTNMKDEELFTQALKWTPFIHFIEMFYLTNKADHLTDLCRTQLTQASSAIVDRMDRLEKGTILVKDFSVIAANFDTFDKLVKMMTEKDNKKIGDTYIRELVNLRYKELHAFRNANDHVTTFLNMCSRIKVDIQQLEEKHTAVQIIEELPLARLSKPSVLGDIMHLDTHIPEVTAFGLSTDILDVLPRMGHCLQSQAFTNMWDRIGQRAARQKAGPLTVDETMEQVWTKASTWWTDLHRDLGDGSMTFQVFNKVFERMDIETLESEFSLMEKDGPWMQERLKQICLFRDLEKCVEGAEIILDVVKTYELKGDFGPINLITSVMTGTDIAMNKLDDSLMQTCSVLGRVEPSQIECLREFITCNPLILWLKESMPSGLKELKVFVDLASISAGEGDIEIAKVQCLHSATTGYAPLIFNLNDDIDYKEFLKKCEMVWKELKADPKLPKKLHDTNRQLEWLKTVKKAHGSVEVTSLSQTEAINSVGIYQVGRLPDKEWEQKPDLKDVISLHVSEDTEGTRQRKIYHYDLLHDLQSRLMLVAGKAEKGKDDVDRFILILDSVVRLANVYIKLVSAGCVLFSDWKVRFLCDKSRRACSFITFGIGENVHTLKGRKATEDDDVSTIVPRLAKFMEQCFDKWLQYISKKRDEYYELNYLTIDQMVILQRELVKVGTDDEPSKLILPLLSGIRKDCSMAELISAMQAAQKEVETMDDVHDEEMQDSSSEEEMEEREQEVNFIREVMKTGYSEALAKKALRHCSADNIDEGVVWCMDHEEDMDTEESSTDAMVEEGEGPTLTDYHGWTDTHMSISAVTDELLSTLDNVDKEVHVDPLIKDLEKLWERFLTSSSSSVSDYLSVEHLGLILRQLAQKETFTVDRLLIQSFKRGVPNLIICPQNDILNTVLTIYLNNKQQPLPQPDEVLICSSHTTLDQLDIFWRRAVFNQTGRIYCLANSDLLDYDVSDRGEQCLENHMQRAKEKEIQYKLVVLCSTENEYKSRIVAALERFRRPPLPVASQQMIQSYLHEKLKVDKDGDINPASLVDFGRSAVRVVRSWRAGVGKTLYKTRRVADLEKLYPANMRTTGAVVSIPLHEKEIDVDMIMARLLQCTLAAGRTEPRIIHIDISYEVYVGVDAFLFQLLVLGSLMDSTGYVWVRSPFDHYLVEAMPLLAADTAKHRGGEKLCVHRCFEILPVITCRSPEESLRILQGRQPLDYSDSDLLFDDQEFKSAVFQRPYQYLRRLDERLGLADINPHEPEGDQVSCLETYLRHCGIGDPSWAEVKHFVYFLNSQLQDFEVSAFCGSAAKDILPGFDKFVLKFLIQMSRDFATRSLVMSEESPIQRMQRMALRDEEGEGANDEEIIQQFQMRRTWESSPHPYLFFNPDHHSMTFVGFKIQRATGDLLDQQTGAILERRIMLRELQEGLVQNKVNIDENFDTLPRPEKILKLCSVMGMDMPHDPDDTYELTTDNVKKMLAIYMRFKCDIPVIIMGETGCGKTRLVKFMCALQCPPGVELRNMILMKVHGGTKTKDIIKKVTDAEKIARENANTYGDHIQTVLFFDEANTTEAIGLIKEIMCDRTIGGNQLQLCRSLKIIAACNPYRKHSEELIQRLEQAGLGYHVHANETTDTLGRVPLRRLVYRVQPLPQSLLPLVWDFGQLDTQVEELYIRQMVLRYIREKKLPNDFANLENVMSKILTVSQDFMRQQKDECSFVSLRDVERVLEVMSWFYAQTQSQDGSTLFGLLDDSSDEESDQEDMEEEEGQDTTEKISDITRSLVLALGVCYHACLKKRKEYRQAVSPHFVLPCPLPGPDPAELMLQEIEKCQDAFLNNVQLGKNIAHNQALKENVFMMVTCIELRIPLFLVGKPGSSKSLAKTVVDNAMQGHASHYDLFKEYKEVQMMSYQCSPLSTPDGISGMFRQCAQFQKDKDLTRFVSVVVLDEIGLAEDSPRMPLKTLHPLLEDGCEGDEKPEPYKKAAFIGISNWALDPAKMNRGILVQREVPALKELQLSAKGICSTKKDVYKCIKPLIPQMARAYLQLFQKALEMREFFGLRDFYSLLKMVYAFADQKKRRPTWHQLQHAIRRNFGGMDTIDPVEVFMGELKTINITERRHSDDPDCSPAGLIQACLTGETKDSESRYLLLLTENYGALTILQQEILQKQKAITIFGSSFPSDQEYTQVCRNINRIKVCMETGNTVVLLNLENLYESLYDALNQYYVEFGGERYVDLGLGTHRVKCRVHKDFRLIVVAEKKIVYEKFPIPLINRLEKHFLNVSTMLTKDQQELTEKLEQWAKDFVECQGSTGHRYALRRMKKEEFSIGDVFMGYHADSCAAIVLHVYQEHYREGEVNLEKVCESAKRLLLWCATPDSVMRFSNTMHDKDALSEIYWQQQKHECLSAYLYQMIRQENSDGHFGQVTTHSKLITSADLKEMSHSLGIPEENMMLLNLQSFDTEQQFCRQIRACFSREADEMLLMVQSDSGDQNASLVACARYSIQDELQQLGHKVTARIHAIFVIQLPRIAGGCFNGFQCGRWHSLHIDDLRPNDGLSMSDMQGRSVGMLIHNAIRVETGRTTEVPMETDISAEQDGRPSDMDIDEEDIQLDFDNMSEHNTRANLASAHKLPVRTLILSCIQAALAMVKDAKMDSARSTVRVQQLLYLLPYSQSSLVSNNLVSGLCKHLDILLSEKEKSAANPGNWLATEAAKAEVINTAGTFRRAWTQCMETKVTPILAGIIAFLDTNRNLDSLYRSSEGDWVQQLWLRVINCTQVTRLQYAHLVSPGRTQQELPEVVVRHTGTDAHLFTAEMPFSWLFFRLIEDLLRTTRTNKPDADELDKVNTIRDVLTSGPMGIMLQPIMDSDRSRILKAYINDFVHMIYHVTSPEEHQLVCESVHIGARTILKEMSCDGVAMLVAIHVAYHEYNKRFHNFSNLHRVWSECSQSIIDFQESSPNFFLYSDEEMTLDVMGLRLLLEKLVPEKETLNKVASRGEWLQSVRHYRPVVERLLDMVPPGQSLDNVTCGRRCVKGIHEARLTWSSVLVVKMFLEHVCSTDGDDKFTIKRCMPLWTMMKTGADMKTVECLEKVEKFLKMCNKLAVAHYFDISKNDKCTNCENELEGPPVYLPCKDKICTKCYHELMITEDMTCPVCHTEIPTDFKPNDNSNKTEKSKKYFDYKKRINSFFMEVVSQLCFADETPPSNEVVEKLLGYITRSSESGKVVTKKMSIFDDSIDPTPVLRSFLLQLLLRTSEDQVSVYLRTYLERSQIFLKDEDDQSDQSDQSQLIELCLLILQCLEDVYHQDVSKDDYPEKKEIRLASDLLRHAQHVISSEELSEVKLYTLAETRFGLSVAAKYVQKVYVDKSEKMTQSIRHMLDAAAKLCEECGFDWPCIFFIKQLCRSYGLDSYQAVCNSGDAHVCRWLRMLNLERDEVLECSDLFVVCGDEYSVCREMVTKCSLGQDPAALLEQIDGMRSVEWKKRVNLLLAVYREIAMSNVYEEEKRKTRPESVEGLLYALSTHQLFNGQDNLLKALFQNTIWRRLQQLNIHPGMELRDQSIVCLLAHVGITFLQIPDDKSLLQPLITLALLPQNMRWSFLPTMPQDNLAKVKEALLAGRVHGGNENPVFYLCPNGHPYIIGDCGRPYVQANCKDCGAVIGGHAHQAAAGNVKDDGTDKTRPGHILGRAGQRTDVIFAERNMSRITCAVLRLLTHAAMLLGANENPLAICDMIKPDITQDMVGPYLWEHIRLDITSIQRVIGRNVDEVLLIVHKVLARLMDTYNHGGGLKPALCNLATKEARNQWEELFDRHCLTPLLQDLDGTLKKCNRQLTQDKRLGSDPLLCLLFEIDTPQEQVSAAALHKVASVWRFRTRISMDHLETVFQTEMDTRHQILRLFFEEDCHLRTNRLVPSILRLQRMLIHKYQRKLDRAEALTFTVSDTRTDFIQDGKEEEVRQLIHEFSEAWNCVRHSLEPCPTPEGIVTVSNEYSSQQITDDTPISMLLPTQKDAGLCSYALVYTLLKKQNSFLEKYCKAKKQKVKDLPKVKVHDLSPAHLISYHPDRDILPIILANCNYSFEVGKGTKIEYDFGNIERQLGDRFLFAKSYIDIDEIDLMTYRSEVTNAVVFGLLREKIPQVQLWAAVRHQICQELRDLPDICDCLDKLDITISFLKSVGEDPTSLLDNFMSNTLKLPRPLASPKSKAACECQHTQSLWLTLAQEKIKYLAKHKKEVFDSLDDNLKKELPQPQEEALRYLCEGLQADKIDFLMELLFECIMLRIAIPPSQDDDDVFVHTLNQSLKTYLQAYLDSRLYDEEPHVPDWLDDMVNRLDGEGLHILVCHCVKVWLLLFDAYSRKVVERRR